MYPILRHYCCGLALATPVLPLALICLSIGPRDRRWVLSISIHKCIAHPSSFVDDSLKRDEHCIFVAVSIGDGVYIYIFAHCIVIQFGWMQILERDQGLCMLWLCMNIQQKWEMQTGPSAPCHFARFTPWIYAHAMLKLLKARYRSEYRCTALQVGPG